jgi:competence ComEA-like helix-hairpin-helix protein
MNWKIQRIMQDKSSFRLIAIGFLSGIVFSGLIFLTLNIIHVYKVQNLVYLNSTPISSMINPITPGSTSGKIDLNQATLAQLETLPGIGETKANAILDFRNKYGGFESISELTYVPGIGNTLLKSIQDLVIIK